MQKENKILKVDLKSKETTISETQTNITDFQVVVNLQADELEVKNNHIQTLEKQIKELRIEIKQLQSELSQNETKFKNTVQEIENVKSSLQTESKKNTELNANISQIKLEKQKLVVIIDDNKVTVDKLEESKIQLQITNTQLSELQKKATILQSQIQDFNTFIDLREKIKNMTVKVSELRHEQNVIQKTINDLQQHNKKISSERSNIEGIIQQIKNDEFILQLIEYSIEAKHNGLSYTVNIMKELEKQLHKLTSDYSRLLYPYLLQLNDLNSLSNTLNQNLKEYKQATILAKFSYTNFPDKRVMEVFQERIDKLEIDKILQSLIEMKPQLNRIEKSMKDFLVKTNLHSKRFGGSY